MRILIVGSAGGMGDALRIQAIRRFYEEAGHQVDYLGFVFAKPVLTYRQEALKALAVLLRRRTLHGLRTFIRHYVDQLEWERSTQAWAKQVAEVGPHYDLIQAEMTTWAYVVAIAGIRNVKWVFDMHGLAAEEARGGGAEYEDVVRAATRERQAAKGCDTMLVVSEAMKEYVVKTYDIPTEKVIVVPNGAYPSERRAKYRRPLRLIFGGVLVYWNRVTDYIHACSLLQAQGEFECFLMGAGADLLKILEEADRLELSYAYLGRRSWEASRLVFSEMQIGMMPMRSDPAKYVCAPMKLLDYAACGLPVVASNTGPWAEVIEEHGFGVKVQPESAEALAEAVPQFEDPKRWQECSDNAVAYVRDHATWDRVLQPLRVLWE